MSTESLAQGIERLGIDVPAAAENALVAYLALIEKWNKVYNLTAIRDRGRMEVEHVLDSLAVIPHVRPGRVLDVGSGAGLPGIPLAIVRPGWHVSLLDSNHKRCAFLRQAVIELGLRNAEAVCERIEAYRPEGSFDTVISRAFAETQHFARVAVAHVDADGVMAAMKGLYPHEELAQLPPGVALHSVVPLTVPGLDAQRHLVVMTKA
jgi:16S rRNA (guanine527-N7)-methyltransferase